MGRIIASVVVENILDPSRSLRVDAFVDTGASHLVLPKAWKERLGEFPITRTVAVQIATQARVEAEICGPVRLQIEGFPEISSEVLFVEMTAADGGYQPLLGYIPLEQSQAAVDMLGHRLVPVSYLDLR
jgi:predicted aspartyl protease